MTELCAAFGVSRKTGYKILKRFRECGDGGLRDRPRAPAQHPNQTDADVEGLILRVRKEHPTWGSKKILAVLERDHGGDDWPARSTIDQVLKRAGVVTPRRLRRRQPSGPPRIEALAPNDVWSIDYKGWIRSPSTTSSAECPWCVARWSPPSSTTCANSWKRRSSSSACRGSC